MSETTPPSNPPPNRASGSLRQVAKALLLCRHAQELSEQCSTSLRNGNLEVLNELQNRKQTIIEELAHVSQGLDVANLPELRQSVERLRLLLHAEIRTTQNEASNLQEQLVAVRNSQKRLIHARQYDNAASAYLPQRDHQLSACG